MNNFYTINQLAERVDRTEQTLRLHIKQRWLVASKSPGVRGWRVTARDAQKWAAKHFGIDINKEPTP